MGCVDILERFAYYIFIFITLPAYTDISFNKKKALLGLYHPGIMDCFRDMDDYK